MAAETNSYKESQDAFLAENAQKEGWVTTESGLQYLEVKAGDGKSPTPEDFVEVHYELTLTDGSVVDSSYARGDTITFPAGRLIPGWVEGLQLMQEGDEWQMVIPADLGYGPNGRPGLPGHSALIFKIELFKVLTEEEMIAEGERKLEALRAEQSAFLDENAKKDGVTVTESGAQYEILASGDAAGPHPEATDNVEVHYRGTLIDGTEFDSSYKRGQTASFPLDGVISGWTEVVQLMVPGDKWRLTLPYNLAYGERGNGRNIPPYATLIFEIELIGIEGK